MTRLLSQKSGKPRIHSTVALSLLGAAGAATLGLFAFGINSNAQTTDKTEAAPVISAPLADAPATPQLPAAQNTDSVVDAANAFLATLSPEQRKLVQIEMTPDNAARWSNFPAGVVRRNGVFFRDLNETQSAAALKVARLALSDDGFTRMQEVRAGDDAYATSDGARNGPGGGGPGGNRGGGRGGFGTFGADGDNGPGGGGGPNGEPGGFGRFGDGGPNGGPDGGPNGDRGGGAGGGNLFGAGNYIIAFLGAPSKTAPWLLELGGHHLAFNLTYKGSHGSSTPYFVGVQPSIWKDAKGTTHEPLAPMHNTMHDLVNSLAPEQLKQAHLSARFSDVYVGPGRDGRFPTRSDGVPVAQLSDKSKALVKQAIAAWTGDAVQGAQYRKLYESELAQTKVAYSGGTTLGETGDYVRIDGPHVWIEFSVQGSDHYHTIWRDRATDYGAELTF